MSENRPLDGKVALVTGASAGIGRSCAEGLARDGAALALADRLRGVRYSVVEDVDDADVAIVTEVGEHVGESVEKGSPALLLPGPHGFHPRTDLFTYHELPPGENWNLASVMHAHDSPPLEDRVGN